MTWAFVCVGFSINAEHGRNCNLACASHLIHSYWKQNCHKWNCSRWLWSCAAEFCVFFSKTFWRMCQYCSHTYICNTNIYIYKFIEFISFVQLFLSLLSPNKKVYEVEKSLLFLWFYSFAIHFSPIALTLLLIVDCPFTVSRTQSHWNYHHLAVC